MNADNTLFISNEFLRAGISTLGAELISLTDGAGREYIWQRGPSVWNRSAPLLFPVIGRLRDGRYTHRGAEYLMGRHGFARDSAFTPLETRGGRAAFRLTDTPASREVYPFSFEFTVSYELRGYSLIKEQRVENRSGETMYYELGGHDAYTLCWQEGEKITDYFVEFEGTDALNRIATDENVMLTEKRTSVPLDGGKLHISRELFANDAVMTEGLTVRRASIGSTKNSRRVTMEFGDFPYFAVWSPYKDFDVPFTCLEPWSTLPDGTHLDHAIENKQGIRRLAPGESEILAFRTTITE